MAHHKRHRAKNQRSGCLMCKHWKVNGANKRGRLDGERFSDARRRRLADAEIRARGGES